MCYSFISEILCNEFSSQIMVHEQQDRLTADVATLRVQMFGNYIVSKGATRRGAEGAQAPLSNQNTDVCFLSFSPTL